MAGHIYMPIGLEVDALCLKQRTLAAPAGGRTAFLVDHTMTGKRLGPRRVAKRATNHTRMAGPTC